MFTLPVISNSSRLAPDTSPMMHLNALNGSAPGTFHDDNVSGLPSYEEAVSNAPLFGLFNVNQGDVIHYHQQQNHQCHNHQSNNNHLSHFTQAGYPPPVYQELSSARSNDSKRPGGQHSSRLSAGDTVEEEESCDRFARISIVSNPSLLPSPRLSKSPRLRTRNSENKSHASSSEKTGSGNGSWRKQLTVEGSALSSAKERLYRVFSPMLSRAHDRHTDTTTKGGRSGRLPVQKKAGEENSDEDEATTHPVRMYLSTGHSVSCRADHFDDIGRSGKQHKLKSHHHHRHHHAK